MMAETGPDAQVVLIKSAECTMLPCHSVQEHFQARHIYSYCSLTWAGLRETERVKSGLASAADDKMAQMREHHRESSAVSELEGYWEAEEGSQRWGGV